MRGVVLLFCGYGVVINTGFLFLGSGKGFFEVGFNKFFIFLCCIWGILLPHGGVKWSGKVVSSWVISHLSLSLAYSAYLFVQLVLELSCSFELISNYLSSSTNLKLLFCTS